MGRGAKNLVGRSGRKRAGTGTSKPDDMAQRPRRHSARGRGASAAGGQAARRLHSLCFMNVLLPKTGSGCLAAGRFFYMATGGQAGYRFFPSAAVPLRQRRLAAATYPGAASLWFHSPGLCPPLSPGGPAPRRFCGPARMVLAQGAASGKNFKAGGQPHVQRNDHQANNGGKGGYHRGIFIIASIFLGHDAHLAHGGHNGNKKKHQLHLR